MYEVTISKELQSCTNHYQCMYTTYGTRIKEPDARNYFGKLPVDLPRFPGILMPAVVVITTFVAVG